MLSWAVRNHSKKPRSTQVSIYFQTTCIRAQNKLHLALSRTRMRPRGPNEVENPENLQEFTRILVKSGAVGSHEGPAGSESTCIGPTHHQLQFRDICGSTRSVSLAVYHPISLPIELQEFTRILVNGEKSQRWRFLWEICQIQVLILCSNSLF